MLNKPKCRDCWARFYCSGGCHANADLFHGDIRQPYEVGCEIQKKRLETSSDECKQDMDKLEKELNSVRQKIRSLMETDSDQSDKLFPLIDREAQLQAQMAKTMYRVRQQIDRVLTEEQLTEFRARMKADLEKRHNKEIPTPKPENKKKQSKR